MSQGPRAFIAGWPIGHSKSPLIHTFWLQQLGIEGSYESLALKPELAFEFFSTFHQQGFVGGNATIPHKEVACRAAAHSDALSTKLGASNTLVFRNDVVESMNTDGEGFLTNLDNAHAGWDESNKQAMVLGAGGASRAICYALLERKFENIILVNRSLDKAYDIQHRFGPKIIPVNWSGVAAHAKNTSCMINTTSLGMIGQPELVLDLSMFRPDCVVTDAVYSPLETLLLQKAKQRGMPAIDGLGMLLYQAVPGFELWFGQRPTVTPELRQLVIAAMEEG